MQPQKFLLEKRILAPDSGGPVPHHSFASLELRRGTHRGCSLEVIQNLGDLDQIEREWDQLVSPLDPPFSTFGWNRAWYRHYGSSFDEMLVFVLRRAGRVAGIFPACLRGDAIHFAAGEVSSNVDVIALDQIDAGELWKASVDWVGENRADVGFSLHFLSDTGKLYGFLMRQRDALKAEWNWRRITSVEKQEIDLEGGCDDYLQALESREEEKLRAAVEDFHVSAPAGKLNVLRGAETKVNDIESAVEFAYQEGGENAIAAFSGSHWISWLGEVSKDPECGWQMATFTNEGDVVAFHCGFVRGERFYELFRCGSEDYAAACPAENLFLLRIDDWEFFDQIRFCEVREAPLPAAAKTREVAHHTIELRPLSVAAGQRGNSCKASQESDREETAALAR